MAKTAVFFFLFLFSSQLHSQNSFLNVDKALKEKYPEKKTFVADGLWIYHPQMGDIKMLTLPNINKLLPDHEFYSANLTYYLDGHIEPSDCLILLSKKDNSVKLVPPTWFDSSIEVLLNSISGHEFKENEIKDFISEAEKLILLGTEMRLGKTIYEKDKIILHLILQNHDDDDIWRVIEFSFDDNKLLGIVSHKR